jgi:hypothetical protein
VLLSCTVEKGNKENRERERKNMAQHKKQRIRTARLTQSSGVAQEDET